MRKIKIDNEYYYIDDENTDIGTGEAIPNIEKDDIKNLEDTARIKIINPDELLEDTITDLWGGKND